MVYRKAVICADRMHRKNGGTRYYILPSTKRGKIIILDRTNVRLLKRKHYINDKMRMKDVENNAFYYSENKKHEAMHELLKIKGRKRFIFWSLGGN